jgi:hypothetical protein
LPDAIFEAIPYFDQKLVSYIRAQTIVDDLEAIKIEEEHSAHTVLVSTMPSERVLQTVDEENAIWQSGQVIMERVVMESLFDYSAVVDVCKRTGNPQWAAVQRSDCASATQHPAIGSAAVPKAMFAFESRCSTAKVVG